MKEPESNELYSVIRKIHEDHRDEALINPTWMATQAMVVIGFPRSLHELGYIGCHLELRQIAREFCRKKFDLTQRDPLSDDLFPETLQHRYPRRPAATNSEPEYVLRALMSVDDYDYNIGKLGKAGAALLKHRNALEADKLAVYGRNSAA